MGNHTINDAERHIVTELNINGYIFPELKNRVFYYNEVLECFTTVKKDFIHDLIGSTISKKVSH